MCIRDRDEAVRKQQNAAGDAASLKQQVAAQENYVASLKMCIRDRK